MSEKDAKLEDLWYNVPIYDHFERKGVDGG